MSAPFGRIMHMYKSVLAGSAPEGVQKVLKKVIFWTILGDPLWLKNGHFICRQMPSLLGATLSMDFDHFLEHFWVIFGVKK